ncbi:MAG: 2-amino-4-hydroxy-6-hydroxymethyldihydropteridine diphosphokinase [Planctomycetota bacterium]|nr:2-amino-4-hydroxy-6-hydroxymethyldihydropteridine diphosphokinase [Planctomycetota bacterium]
MNSAIVALGSNINPSTNMAEATCLLDGLGTVIASSPLIWTKPQGFADQDRFLNGAAQIQTPLDQVELVTALKGIEAQLKRVKTVNRAGPRTIDLDLIQFNGQVQDPHYTGHSYLRLPVCAVLSKGDHPLSEAQSADAKLCSQLAKLPDWSLDEDALEREWTFQNFATALDFINRVGAIAEALNHHPDLRLHSYKCVEARLYSHSEQRVTARDVQLAIAIEPLAKQA